jgi:hypothetical protein
MSVYFNIRKIIINTVEIDSRDEYMLTLGKSCQDWILLASNTSINYIQYNEHIHSEYSAKNFNSIIQSNYLTEKHMRFSITFTI